MKKNKMMRAASALLVATLLSTSIISGTFAKYTTTASANDTARVAKWGVVITASGNLYGKNYETGTESIPSVKAAANELSVMASDNSSNLVAPGTKSEHGLSFDLNGTPEVRTSVKVTATAQDIYLAAGSYAVMQKIPVDAVSFVSMKTAGLYTKAQDSDTYTLVDKTTGTYEENTTYYALTDFVKLDEAYYPVTYTNTNNDANATKITDIAQKIVNNIATSTSDTDASTAKASYTATTGYNPNVDLGNTTKLSANNISWEWKFEANNDAKDTILGDIMAGSTVVKCTGDTSNAVTAVTVLTTDKDTSIVKAGETEVGSVQTSFKVEITATQVD